MAGPLPPALWRRLALLAAAVGAVGLWPAGARAHTTGGAFILLLPTHLYLTGGAIVVAVSFVFALLLPARLLAHAERLRVRLAILNVRGRAVSTGASLVSLGVVFVLIVAGIWGSRDPLANPLPLFVWSVWWIGFTYLHALLGDLWVHLNPWSGIYRLLTAGRRRHSSRPASPSAAGRDPGPGPALGGDRPALGGHWPAVVGFALFAWFELIHPAPSDPAVLAAAVTAYLLAHFVGVFLFGERWLYQAESFSVFFRVISWLAPFGSGTPAGQRAGEAAGPRELYATLPTLKLLSVETPRLSIAAFVLLVLSSVSFDGLSRTFAWLGLLGVNPLAYPGRTALMGPNTLGLVGVFTLLSLAYVSAVVLGARLAVLSAPVRRLVPLFVLSLVPIACGYHFAHYLPALLVDIQYALRAASDPFARGWDVLGTRDVHVVTSFLSDPSRVYMIWHSQVAIIVGAHVAGVFVAHALALRVAGGGRAAGLGQLPLLALMIGYTLLGLWLLSTPAVG